MKKVWFDIINPPQARYMIPLLEEFLISGYSILLTTRNYSTTVDLLGQAGHEAIVVGKGVGSSKVRKIVDSLTRAIRLSIIVLKSGIPDILITGSRSSSLAASILSIPDFAFCDYEYAELKSHQILKSYLVFPAIIPKRVFIEKGFLGDRLIAYNGLKEDITFSKSDYDNIEPMLLPTKWENKRKILLRPPATQSHYYKRTSGDIYHEVLKELSTSNDCVVVFSPRYPWMIDEIRTYEWCNQPLILDNCVDTIALLKAVDVVVSSGGTMIREAAFWGIHAISIFAGEKCSVDTYLEAKGLLIFAQTIEQFRDALAPRKREHSIMHNTNVLNEITEEIQKRIYD